jgi:hypothetical protein
VKISREIIFESAFGVLLLGVMISALLSVALGHFTPEIVPDTQSYLFPFEWPDLLAQQRTPFYGLFVAALGGAKTGFKWIPLAHAIPLAGATLLFYHSARVWGVSGPAALALTLPIPFSNAVLLYLNSVHPEVLSIACTVVALAAVILFSARPRFIWLILCGASIGFGYLLKPALLLFIPVLPVLYFLLARLHGETRFGEVLRHSLKLIVATSFVFLAYGGLRAAKTGDFNIVSFGGFASVGMSGLMLTPATVEKLPDRHRALAKNILIERERLANAGTMLPIPLNSQNQRSFVSAALGYFDVLARSYDNVVFSIVAPLQADKESWIAFNARLQDFTVAVIKAEPFSYAAWIIGAATRVVGLITVANASFMVATIVLIGLFLATVAAGRADTLETNVGLAREVTFLLIVVGAYTLASTIPMLLMTFPARRYVDMAGLLLASLPILGVIRLTSTINGSRGPKRDIG